MMSAAQAPGPARVLLVEDTAIIALDIEDMLQSDGLATVSSVTCVADALDRLAAENFEFAILDFNLGDENSLPVAERLTALGIPFIFMSGYGSETEIGPEYSDIPVLDKPLHPELITGAMKNAVPHLKA